MATPHIAGAIALAKEYMPSASPDQIECVLKKSGVSLTDSDNGLSFPRIDLLAAITYIYTRSLFQTSLITFIHHGSFLIIFYLHERAWLRVRTKFRPILKAITYEIVLGNLVLGVIIWLVAGNWLDVTGITLTYIGIKLVMYPVYEYCWMKKEKIIYTYVCGDILHKGHLNYLNRAKEQGDYLIVGVLTKEAVMEKKSEPIMEFTERLELVKNLRQVDEVIPQITYSALPTIKKINPDVLIESDSHKEQPANEYVKSYGGKVVVIPYYRFQSSTSIKNKINSRKNT